MNTILNWLEDNKYYLQSIINPITLDYLEELANNSTYQDIIKKQYCQLVTEVIAIEAGKALALSPQDLLEYIETLDLDSFLTDERL